MIGHMMRSRTGALAGLILLAACGSSDGRRATGAGEIALEEVANTTARR